MTTPIKLETVPVALALVRVEVLSDKQAKASIYLGDTESTSATATVECGFGRWASATEAVVCALESLMGVIREESKKIGIPIRTIRHLDATKPRGDLS